MLCVRLNKFKIRYFNFKIHSSVRRILKKEVIIVNLIDLKPFLKEINNEEIGK